MSLISHSSPIRTRSTEGPGLKPHLLAGDPVFHYHTWSSFPEAPFLGGIDIIDIKQLGIFRELGKVLCQTFCSNLHRPVSFFRCSKGSGSPSDLCVSSAGVLPLYRSFHRDMTILREHLSELAAQSRLFTQGKSPGPLSISSRELQSDRKDLATGVVVFG